MPQRAVLLESLIVWLVLCIVYLLTLAGNHSEAEDGIRYLNDILSGDPANIFSPYHLIYSWLGWAAYHLALLVGYDGGPLLPVQVMNAFTGALGVALVWSFLRMVTRSRTVAVAGCGMLAFSYGYWWYSVEVEVYVFSVVLLIFSLFFAYHAAMSPRVAYFAALGGTNGLAVLMHVTNVLFAVVALVALLFAMRMMPLRSVAKCTLAYAGAGAGVVVPAYALAISVIGLDNPGEIYDWQTDYAQNDAWGRWGFSTVPKVIVGAGRALVGGHFAISFEAVRDLAYRLLPSQSLREEVFLVRGLSPVLAGLLFLLLLIVSVGLLILAVRWLSRPRLDERARTLAALCLGWLVPYAIFFAWWEPDNVEFWIAPWVPLVILLVLPLSAYGPATRQRMLPVVFITIGALFAVNLWGSVLPQHSPENDYWQVRYSWYEQNARTSDLVVANDYIGAGYLRYFSRAEVVDAGPLGKPKDVPGELRHRIQASDAQRVLFSSDSLYPAADKFTRCGTVGLCERAAAIREEFLSRTRLVSDEPLEEVRVLNNP